MSISSGEFDARQPDDQHEKEKVRSSRPIVSEDESNGTFRDGEAITPPSNVIVVGYAYDDKIEDSVSDVNAPRVGIRPKHYPPPSSVQAPKPLSKSPVVTGKLKQHLKKKSTLLFSSSTKSVSSLSRKEGKPAPTVSSSERTTPSNEGFRSDHAKPSHEEHSVSAASLVVCGVDGTVYTLDAYTGQLRGMFASGPALVFSSSPDEDDSRRESDGDEDIDLDDESINAMNGMSDGDAFDDQFNGDLSNAIASHVSPGTKMVSEKIVPGLDGRLYSLIEIADGVAKIEDDVNFEKCQSADDDEFDDLDHACGSKTSHDERASKRSGDGNSNIIPRYGTYNLTPLPISAMDVVDSPISTCRPTGEGGKEQQEEQCGIIVGSKKTTIYAIDPKTGKVRWTQDPQGGGGGRGFTTRPPRNTSRGRMVLLQREDYAVKHLDTDGGGEVWKVELGQFSALDFDLDVNSRGSSGRSSASHETSSDHDDTFFGSGDPSGGEHIVGGRRRGAAAAAASVDSNDKKKKSSMPPILGRKKTSLHDFDTGFGYDQHTGGKKDKTFDEDEFDHDHSAQFRGFPSIAFGEDGTSLMAADGISGELLWKRRIESVVAAVYGVGIESSWIPLDVVDESDVFTHGHISASHYGQKVGLSPPSSPPSPSNANGGLVPYGAGQVESGHRLGRHHSSLFVSSKYDAHPLGEPRVDELPYATNVDRPLPPNVNGHEFHRREDRIFAMNPSGTAMDGVKPAQSHRTEHGLYLTWSMVAAIVMLVLSVVVFVARVIILRQKRKWGNSPSLDPTTAPSSSSEDEIERSYSSGEVPLPPPVQNLNAQSSANSWSKKNLPVTRSFSLDALRSHSMGTPGSNVAQPFISETGGPTVAFPEIPATDAPQLNVRNGSPPPSVVAATASHAPSQSKTIPSEANPPDKSSLITVDNIDGVPLVRYSRYRSEFKEILPLGRGGFGTVFQCQNTLDSREYAIKKIKIISQSVDGKATRHFSQKLHRVLREVKCLALLDHPNIVRYYTAWLEVDDGIQSEDDETHTTSSMFDRKSHGIFSSTLFSGFGSQSRAMPLSSSPKRSIHQRPTKGFLRSYNPLGWNNFGSLRFDESKSEASSSFGAEQNDAAMHEQEDDLGFTWERSNDNNVEPSINTEKESKLSRQLKEDTLKEDDSQPSSGISSVESNGSTKKRANESTIRSDFNEKVKSLERTNGADCEKKTTEGRHILFIQMQLCSVQTLADFLANHQARSGSLLQSSSHSGYAVDIPLALRLFSQIANGVKYVHEQGLIHRDLKPQNCFIDDAGNVKVGDFGLSRESSTAGGITDYVEEEVGHDDSLALPDCSDAENTAGVGTRAYASPEQMRGSNYDASTDVFSLGLLLFELCYPMYTSMERYKEFGGIRKGHFPNYWISHVETSFATMHDLLVQMISDSPSQRPSADAVSDHVDSLLREYSVQSLDKSWGKKGALLLRVEAEEKEGILAHAMKLIKDAAPHTTILQYGLRGQASRAIMEFALEMADNEKNLYVENISSRLQDHGMSVRRIIHSQ